MTYSEKHREIMLANAHLFGSGVWLGSISKKKKSFARN